MSTCPSVGGQNHNQSAAQRSDHDSDAVLPSELLNFVQLLAYDESTPEETAEKKEDGTAGDAKAEKQD